MGQERPHVTITEALLIEHRVLRQLMQAMEQALLEKVPAAGLRERAKMLEVALDTHATREEDQLFTPLRARAETARHLIEMMEIVHGEVRDLFEQVGSEADPQRTLWTILEMTAAHFDREEQELFPLAVALFGASEPMDRGDPSLPAEDRGTSGASRPE